MFDGTEYSSYSYCPTTRNLEEDFFFGSNKKGKGLNKRRFNDEQIKSLESMFESETRLEPRKKLQLASELGLQPRQVAIWFQNKRARWKSKQIEKDYAILLANYNNLNSGFEALKKEKQGLLVQLLNLNNDLKQRRQEGSGYGKQIDSDDQHEAKPNLSFEKAEHVTSVLSEDDDSVAKADYLGLDEEPDLLNMNVAEPADSSLTSPTDWDELNPKTIFEESTSGCDKWWDFWS